LDTTLLPDIVRQASGTVPEPDQHDADSTRCDVTEAIIRLRRIPSDTPGWHRLRDHIVSSQLELTRAVASRFARRGVELDDLVQVATVGLLKALDRFDADRGVMFAQYAVPTMVGEIKRYFRDHAWAMRVHRPLKDLHLEVHRAEATLSQRLQRTPSPDDIAQELQIKVDQVRAAMGATVAYQPRSLDAPVNHLSTGASLSDQLGQPDKELDLVTDRIVLRQALAGLGDRDRQILQWRFVDCLTQAQIAKRLGVSQMHVSRLLSAAFARIRACMLETA
jgi:RNA polymerase sigma-B factor